MEDGRGGLPLVCQKLTAALITLDLRGDNSKSQLTFGLPSTCGIISGFCCGIDFCLTPVRSSTESFSEGSEFRETEQLDLGAASALDMLTSRLLAGAAIACSVRPTLLEVERNLEKPENGVFDLAHTPHSARPQVLAPAALATNHTETPAPTPAPFYSSRADGVALAPSPRTNLERPLPYHSTPPAGVLVVQPNAPISATSFATIKAGVPAGPVSLAISDSPTAPQVFSLQLNRHLFQQALSSSVDRLFSS